MGEVVATPASRRKITQVHHAMAASKTTLPLKKPTRCGAASKVGLRMVWLLC